MTSDAITPEEYIASLPEDRKEGIEKLRNNILKNLPEGFEETMSYGMIGYVIPLSVYPDGYHAGKDLPLPFINLASQKNHIAIYHMGLYNDENLMKWFTSKYHEQSKTKLDMGKSCIRFKKPESIPFDLIGELASKMTADSWIRLYEKKIKRK